MFLACLLRSSLARYFVFHTAASLGTERDQVHTHEALGLPFFLPDSEAAQPNAASIVNTAAAQLRRFIREMEEGASALLKNSKEPEFRLRSDDEGEEDDAEKALAKWLRQQRFNASKLQSKLNGLIYDYFGINEQERALVEDTVEVFDQRHAWLSRSSAKGTHAATGQLRRT